MNFEQWWTRFASWSFSDKDRTSRKELLRSCWTQARLGLVELPAKPIAWRWKGSFIADGRQGLRLDWQNMPPPPGVAQAPEGQIEYAYLGDGPRLLVEEAKIPERWCVVREVALDVGLGDDVRTGGRPELGYALISDAGTFDSEAAASAAHREANLPPGWVIMRLSRLLPDLPIATSPSAAQVEGAKRLVSDLVQAVCWQERMPNERNQNAYRAARDAVEATLTAAPEKLAPAPQQAAQGDPFSFEQFCKRHGLDPNKMESHGGMWARVALEEARAAQGGRERQTPASPERTKDFPAVKEARRVAASQLGFYKKMMAPHHVALQDMDRRFEAWWFDPETVKRLEDSESVYEECMLAWMAAESQNEQEKKTPLTERCLDHAYASFHWPEITNHRTAFDAGVRFAERVHKISEEATPKLDPAKCTMPVTQIQPDPPIETTLALARAAKAEALLVEAYEQTKHMFEDLLTRDLHGKYAAKNNLIFSNFAEAMKCWKNQVEEHLKLETPYES